MAEEVVLKDVNHIHPLPNFVQDGFDYLPSGIFDNKENFQTVLRILLERLEFIDKKMVELAELRTTLNASDAILDEIGKQLGIYRNGLNDPEYRAVIMILTGNNSKSGTRADIIATLKQLFGDDGVTTYKGYNYRLDINVFNTCMEITDILPQIIDMLPLVTHLRVVENQGYPFGMEGDAQAFGFASVYDSERTGAGGMSTLIYVSDDEEDWSFN
ncbi:hypothetical protein POP15_028 [Pectobacterium phage POP15]|nr:hypothetical protein POP15_028 [Pectobacterium phage POP15]